ncbi:TPA: hypothetical protein SMR58_000410 [Proteus mirabilis]|nr:hypothetical protein [Proteus mirabilis]HEK1835691.1 hypothetical protein [Proteus mirabilis]
MYFNAETLATNSHIRDHWNHVWAIRNMHNAQQNMMMQANQRFMTNEMLVANQAFMAANQLGGFSTTFWAELDNQVIQLRNQTDGMEILDDLMSVQTVLPIGKTLKMYNMVGDIADDVAVSIDGQAPFSFDHTSYDSDGDPIPIYTSGFGVNWRHSEGLKTVGMDLVLDSHMAKQRKHNKRLVSSALDGDASISVDGKKMQGIRNHRNTVKIDLKTASPGGGAIDLRTATKEQLIEFFSASGAFGKQASVNKVSTYDIMWVSDEVWSNLNKPNMVSFGGGNTIVNGTVLGEIMAYIPVKEIRRSFALKGNEFIAYERRKDVISPLVGMPTNIIPLERRLPTSNFNFMLMTAQGMQIKRDDERLSGVIYGGDLS